MILPVNKVLELHERKVAEWHSEMQLTEQSSPWSAIEENMKWNFMLWHEEDIARIPDIDPMRMVEAKQNIDKYNQARNNAMEKIDEWVLSYLEVNGVMPGEKIHSETPGMMIDRLSIMALKKYHMAEEVVRKDVTDEHRSKCGQKVLVLGEQMADLASSLEGVFSDLEASKLRFKVYRQFKMYNDPSLNPALYSREQK